METQNGLVSIFCPAKCSSKLIDKKKTWNEFYKQEYYNYVPRATTRKFKNILHLGGMQRTNENFMAPKGINFY